MYACATHWPIDREPHTPAVSWLGDSDRDRLLPRDDSIMSFLIIVGIQRRDDDAGDG
jgi:hypothetical protein